MNIIEKYGLTIKNIEISDMIIKLYQTENLDKFLDTIDPDEYYKDERFPYFVNVWQSGIGLSLYFKKHFQIDHIKGKSFLELGSGTGIVGIVISLLGGIVTFSDYEEDSLSMCEANYKLNELKDFKGFIGDWRDFPFPEKSFDYIIGSDLLYEKRFVTPLSVVTDYFLRKDSSFILSDPDRNHCPEFIKTMGEKGCNTAKNIELYPDGKQKVNIFTIYYPIKKPPLSE